MNSCSICIELHEPHSHSSHPTNADVDGLEDEFEDASLTSSCNELPPMPISDCAEVTEVDVEVDHAILSSSSSSHHHSSTAPTVVVADDASSTTASHHHHHHNQQHRQYHQQQQHFHQHQQHHSSSNSRLQQQQQQQLHYASNSVVGQISSSSVSSATVSSSRLAQHHPQHHPHLQERRFSQQSHPHPLVHQHIPSSQSQTQLSQLQNVKHHQPPHHQSSIPPQQAPDLVVTSSSVTSVVTPVHHIHHPSSSTHHQVSPNISSSSVSSSQSSPAAGVGVVVQEKQRSPKNNLSDGEAEILRKRLYRVGLNLFNKKPEVGVAYLVKKKFLEGSPPHVARFLISRKGLSKQMVGEYLANLQSPFSMSCLE